MLYYTLVVFRALLFAAVMFFALKLVEDMLDSKHSTMHVRIALSIFNSLISTLLVIGCSPVISFFASFAVFLTEMLIIHRKSKAQIILVLSALIINVMCSQGMASGVISLISGCSLHKISTIPLLNIIAVMLADLFELIGILALTHFMSTKALRLAIKNLLRRKYMVFWIVVCTVFLLQGTVVYERAYSMKYTSFNHFLMCFVLFCCYYVMLTLSYKLNLIIAYESKNKELSQALVTQKQLQSALTKDAIFTSQANLSKNKIIQGLEVYSDQLQGINNEYDLWFDAIELRIHPDDHEIFYEKLNRHKLLDCFEQGTEPSPFEYRRMSNDGKFHWTRLNLRLFSDTVTNDVYVYGYAFDVEKEHNEKQALEVLAHTDSLTKLLNRETAETLIKEEMSKGCGALFLMDIDNFKDINDCMGHGVGDNVLTRTAVRLRDFFGSDSIVGRLGGDEFIAYLKDENDISLLENGANTLLSILSGQSAFGGDPSVTFSLGIARITEPIPFSIAYAQADSALYEVKYSGKNSCKIFEK